MKKEIGNRIRKIRESKDYTQDNMAVELEITAGAYAKIERGETDPSITRLLQIAEILKVDITTLLKDSSPASYLLEEPKSGYGNFATKQDVEKLTQLYHQMFRELEKLKSLNSPKKKITSKKKTK